MPINCIKPWTSLWYFNTCKKKWIGGGIEWGTEESNGGWVQSVRFPFLPSASSYIFGWIRGDLMWKDSGSLGEEMSPASEWYLFLMLNSHFNGGHDTCGRGRRDSEML